jgi:metal-responsive CopG/Arc/MetJ family transcriptional regulator
MNNRIPDEQKKVKISISVDPFLDKKISEMAIDRKFYKKSRFIEYILKKYIEENKSSL